MYVCTYRGKQDLELFLVTGAKRDGMDHGWMAEGLDDRPLQSPFLGGDL